MVDVQFLLNTVTIIIIVGSVAGVIWKIFRAARVLIAETKDWITQVVSTKIEPILLSQAEQTMQIGNINYHLRTLNGSMLKLQEADHQHELRAEYLRGRVDEIKGLPVEPLEEPDEAS